MNGLKRFFKTPLGIFILIGVGAFLILILLVKALTHPAESPSIATAMQDQTASVVKGDVHYTMQETLSTLTGETANIQKGLADVQNQMSVFKQSQSKRTQKMIDALQKELETVKQQNSAMRQQVMASVNDVKKKEHDATLSLNKATSNSTSSQEGYRIGQRTTGQSSTLVWLKDQATLKLKQRSQPSPKSELQSGSVLHPNEPANSLNKPNVIPAYTIPANTAYTDVTPEQPLVGMIPTNGTVVNPQSVLFMLGRKGLAANNWHLPSDLKGMQGRAVCQGVFVWFNDAYVNCQIKSLTFIFNDGRIATANAQENENFGHLATRTGSPNIPGIYHGNALYAGIGTGFFAGLQGFGNAFAAQQQQISDVGNRTVVSYKNALDSGLGSAMGTAGQYMNEWWERLLKSTTNFVYTPNWDPQTHRILQLNAVFTHEVDINYNPIGRKIEYENHNQADINNNLN